MHSDPPVELRDQFQSAPKVSQGDPINAKRDKMDDAFDLIAPPKKLKTSPESPTASITSSSTAMASVSSASVEPVHDLDIFPNPLLTPPLGWTSCQRKG